MRHEHGNKQKQECKTCGAVLKTKHCLVRHMLIHKPESHQKCSHCDKTFTSKYKLCVHVKVEHENIKPYSCGICNASYVHMKNCAQHIATKHENWSQEKADQDYATIAKEHTAFVRNFSLGSRSANYKWVASGPRTSKLGKNNS